MKVQMLSRQSRQTEELQKLHLFMNTASVSHHVRKLENHRLLLSKIRSNSNQSKRNIYPRDFWKSKTNQREFLNTFALQNNIRTPQDWGSVYIHSDKNRSNFSFVYHYYNNSLFDALKSLYPEIVWDKNWWEKRSNWTSQNQRIFFDNLAKEIGINCAKDWGKITATFAVEKGGAFIKNETYKSSLMKALQASYPELEFRKEWFLKYRYWTNKENQRKFFENVAKKMNVGKPKDWGNIPTSIVIENGANFIFNQYNGSLFAALQNSYPEIEWKTEWFNKRPKYNREYWNNNFNQRAFLEEIAIKYKINKAIDWQKATLSSIKLHGGKALIRMHGNLETALRVVFPEENWDFLKMRNPYSRAWRGSSNSQDAVVDILKFIF